MIYPRHETVYARIQEADNKGIHYEFPFVSPVLDALQNLPVTKSLHDRRRKGVKYYDVPCAFDTESTSFSYMAGKEIHDVGCVYIWMFGIDGFVVTGRTWDEFRAFLAMLQEHLKIGYKLRLACYVHNLPWDFQFFRSQLTFYEVFAKDVRVPLYATSTFGIEFRDSYALTNSALKTVGKNLLRYKVLKKTGDLDYNVMRHSRTTLTPEEMGYCINDVLVVMALIMERMESDGGVQKIPWTQTGYARNKVRSACLPSERNNAYWKFRRQMEALTVTPSELALARKCFAGGFTHADPLWTGKICEDVTSYDFTSSYPAVMCFEKYPMAKGVLETRPTKSRFDWLVGAFLCTFRIKIRNIESRSTADYYISESKCEDLVEPVICNGRIVSAKELTICITSVDWQVIKAVYQMEFYSCDILYRYRSDYLPKPFIETILDLYEAKTTLKNVQGKEEEYQRAKEVLNALYGMSASSVIRPEIIYNEGTWYKDRSMSQEEYVRQVNEYNDNEFRFISFIWASFVTAYARRNLWTGIIQCQEDYIYSDTDSLKIMNVKKHLPYFHAYNAEIDRKASLMCRRYEFDYKRTRPKTIKGVEKPLGHWDFDGHYKRFKTLGAKRYLTEDDEDVLHLTVSGVNKYIAIPYLKDKYVTNDAVFEAFSDGLYFPPGKAGKMVIKYIDEPYECKMMDCNGVVDTVSENTSAYMEQSDYTLGLSGEFLEFLDEVQTGYIWKRIED